MLAWGSAPPLSLLSCLLVRCTWGIVIRQINDQEQGQKGRSHLLHVQQSASQKSAWRSKFISGARLVCTGALQPKGSWFNSSSVLSVHSFHERCVLWSFFYRTFLVWKTHLSYWHVSLASKFLTEAPWISTVVYAGVIILQMLHYFSAAFMFLSLCY